MTREYLQDLIAECLEEVSQEGSFEGLIRATVEEREKKNKLQETILRSVNLISTLSSSESLVRVPVRVLGRRVDLRTKFSNTFEFDTWICYEVKEIEQQHSTVTK